MDQTLAASPDKYLQLVAKSRLVTTEQLSSVVAEVVKQHGGLPEDSRPLAKAFIDRGLISAWQNWHLLEGRCRGFFLGKYKLISYLNAGGMSRVYLAEHVLLKRRVAIKLFAEGPQDDGFRLKRFYIESEACAALNHANIVKAFDFDSDGKFHFLVMEYVDGSDLHRLVAKQGPLPFERAAEYVRQAALGLAHAHAAGMIHRDVKPANLLLDRDGTVKILDLGVVRVTRQTENSLTLDQGVHIIGTVDYLPPEQFLDGHNVDARADLYSLGCTLFFLLTGRPPFNKGNQSQRIMMHQTEPAPSVYGERPDCPAGLAQICERLMAKNPDDRFPSATDVANVLGDWLRLHKQGRDWTPPAPSSSWLRLVSDTEGASDTYRGTQLATLLTEQSPAATPAPVPLDV
ncbi:MAG TPA: serine/threonine-protein kinase, partial [Pirellulales bacterium]